jgi:trimethylamine--corrinoid protein Co-methyltransferase
MLETYEMPSIDPSVDEALQAYMKKRKDSFPDQNY